MKKTAYLMIVSLVVVLLAACNNNQNLQSPTQPVLESSLSPDSQTPEDAMEQISIEQFPLHSDDKYVSYSEDSVIVQVSGMTDQTIQNKINRTLQTYADEELAQTIMIAEENVTELLQEKEKWLELYETNDESFFYGNILNQFSVTYLNPHIISVVSDGYVSMMPETHPLKKKQAFVFDLQTGDRLQVKDALSRTSTIEAAFKQLTQDEILLGHLRPEGAEETISDTDTFMSNLNSEKWWIQEKNGHKTMTIFAEAIYAIGFYELDFTMESLGALADAGSPVWK